MTELQKTSVPNPPTQSNAFRIRACGDEASNKTLINDIEKSCSSAVNRLVVVR
jgi:hypothetical protein